MLGLMRRGLETDSLGTAPALDPTLGGLISVMGWAYPTIASYLLKNNKNLFFFIVGSGTLEMQEELNSLIEVENKKNIIFTGYQENIPAVLCETDLFLFFSEGEASPLAILEAMIMQKKILATNVRGTADLLKPYSDECLIERHEDVSLVSEKILKKLSTKNKKTAYEIEQYYFENYLPKVLQIYKGYNDK